MPHRSSVAYQQQAQPAPTPQPKKKPEFQVVKGRKSKVKSWITPQTVLIFFLFVLGICTLVYYQAQLTGVTGDINRLNSQLKNLKSEQVRLESILEPTGSRRLLAERATKELGMNRLDYQNQVTYVTIYREDKVDIAQPEEPEGIVEQIEAAADLIRQTFTRSPAEEE